MASETKRCRRCGDDKPRAEFKSSGIYGGYCLTCAPIERTERAAAKEGRSLPIKRSIKAKAAKKASPSKEASALLKVIPLETPHSNGLGGGSVVDEGDALVNLVKDLIAERNALRSQLDAIEAALVSA